MTSRGSVELVAGTWWLRKPEDLVDRETGEIRRRRRRVRLGSALDLRSRVAARTVADEWLARAARDVLLPGPAVRWVEYAENFLASHATLYRPTSRSKYTAIVRRILNPAF